MMADNLPGQVRNWRRNAAGLTHEDLHVREAADPDIVAVVHYILWLPDAHRPAALAQLALADYEQVIHLLYLSRVADAVRRDE